VVRDLGLAQQEVVDRDLTDRALELGILRHGADVDRTAVRLGNHVVPGREYLVLSKTREAASRNRIFISSAGVYTVSFTSYRGSEGSTLATAFLDSFRIR
jgi:hypothetical protein